MNLQFRNEIDHANDNTMGSPLCPNCLAEMALTRVNPVDYAIDERTFRCARCESTQLIVVRLR